MPLDTPNFLHYYAVGLSFIFGAFLQEWISGKLLKKEKKGTKLVFANKYLNKPPVFSFPFAPFCIISAFAENANRKYFILRSPSVSIGTTLV